MFKIYSFNIFKKNQKENILQDEEYKNKKDKKINNNHSIDTHYKEIDRLNDQTFLIEHIFENKFCAPLDLKELDKNINILDSGCGAGTWLLSMATDYPNVNFYGIDINTIYPDTIKPPNCIFEERDIRNISNYNVIKFYYIKQTLLLNSLKNKDWDDIIINLKNITSDNGWIEFVELELKVYDSGPKYKQFNEIIINTMITLGFKVDIAEKLESMLKKHELKSVNKKIKKVYFNNDSIINNSWYENIKQLHINSEFWLKEELEKKELLKNKDYNEYIDEVIKECKEYCSYYNLYSVYGKKQ